MRAKQARQTAAKKERQAESNGAGVDLLLEAKKQTRTGRSGRNKVL